MNEILIFLLVMAASINTVFSFECYACESVLDEDCGESNFEMATHFKIDCKNLTPPRFLENQIENINSTGCMKKVFIEDGERKVVRSCFFGVKNSTMNSCTRDPSSDPVREVFCDVCTSQFCNDGKRLKTWALANYLKLYFCVAILSTLLHNK